MHEQIPPSNGVPELPPPLPAWPKVIGIISIVWGGLGLLCGGCGLLSPALTGMAMQGSGQELPPAMLPQGPQMVVIALSMLVAVVLIVAGATTVGRKPLGRTLHLVYALLSIPLTAISLWLSMKQQADLAQWASENPDNMFAQQMSNPGQKIGQMMGLVFGAAMGFGYPVFCLIWFGLVKKASDMGSGDAATDPYQPID